MSTLWVLLMGASAVAATPVELSCPAQIETRQELSAPVADWHASTDRTMTMEGKLRPVSMSFSSGPPEEMAILAPDKTQKSRKTKGAFINTWNFEVSDPVWFICGYQQTTIELSKLLPSELRHCSIEYDPYANPVRAWCQ